ncbi:hypothetical protein MKW98_000420 [Papaver atlanticum]|uniref:Uncharacterized protein n=1 Tax=Papaver atlanticum TaxID=357466 RepID=A0AAD4S4I5_9MAGN|nr:hypothetical protein MKW98_000420 [Papaver atlanticum]
MQHPTKRFAYAGGREKPNTVLFRLKCYDVMGKRISHPCLYSEGTIISQVKRERSLALASEVPFLHWSDSRPSFTILVALDSEIQRVGRATASDVLMMGKQKKLGYIIWSLLALVKNVGCCY